MKLRKEMVNKPIIIQDMDNENSRNDQRISLDMSKLRKSMTQ